MSDEKSFVVATSQKEEDEEEKKGVEWEIFLGDKSTLIALGRGEEL